MLVCVRSRACVRVLKKKAVMVMKGLSRRDRSVIKHVSVVHRSVTEFVKLGQDPVARPGFKLLLHTTYFCEQ